MDINSSNQSAHRLRVQKRALRLLRRHQRHKEAYKIEFYGVELVISPGVFSPIYGEGAALLAQCLNVHEGETVLDLGTGSGALAILAARNAATVVAADISSVAVECARLNVERMGLNNKIEVRQGDLFEPLRDDEQFSLIIFNPPFMDGTPTSLLEQAMYDEGYKTLNRFFQGVQKHLTEKGRILLVFSTAGDVEHLEGLIKQSALRATVIKKEVSGLEFFVYALSK